MDVGSPIRQPTPAQLPGQFQSVPKQGPVVTELPQTLTVTAAADVENVRIDINPQAERRARLESEVDARRKQFVIDDKSKDVIFRTVDVESGEVVQQYPDDWQIKQRAYSRAMIEKQFEAQQRADVAGSFAETVAKSA
jgi:hypothetical protein